VAHIVGLPVDATREGVRILRSIRFGLWFVFVLFAFSVLAVPLHAREKVLKLRYSNMYPQVHPFSKLTEEWCKEVEKRTEGRVKISYFAGSTLTLPTQTYDSVIKGITDLGMTLIAYSPGRFPLTEVLTLPLGYTSGYQATKAANAYLQKFKPKEFDDGKIMYLHCSPPGYFLTRKVITTIDEVKGLRIKANAEIADIVTVFGGGPVIQPITESYESIQKGLLDGLLLPVETLKGWKLAEVIKGVLETHATAYTTSFLVVMNREKWNSLSEADQTAIEKINEEWIEKQGKTWDVEGKLAREFSLEKGVKFVQLSAADNARAKGKVKPLFGDYVKRTRAKGLPAEDALRFMQEYLKTHP
jgi:TRAP-type transport system periplasmic protein